MMTVKRKKAKETKKTAIKRLIRYKNYIDSIYIPYIYMNITTKI